MAAAAPVVDGDHVLQQVYLFLVLPRDGEGVVFCRERLFFPFLFKEALLYLIFLLLPDLYHHFFDSGVHLFAIFLAGETVSVDPGVLEQIGQRNAFFGVRVQHFLDEVSINLLVTFEVEGGSGFGAENVPKLVMVEIC